MAQTQTCGKIRDGMSRHGHHVRVAYQEDSVCKATVIGQHEEESRNWSKDQTVIAMSSGEAELHAACMAAQQAMGTENMARELGVHLDAMELQVDANAAIGIIDRQGLGTLRHLDLSFLSLQ